MNYFKTLLFQIMEYFDCSKYKRLYLEENKKYKDLKHWTEQLILSNSELLEKIKSK